MAYLYSNTCPIASVSLLKYQPDYLCCLFNRNGNAAILRTFLAPLFLCNNNPTTPMTAAAGG